MAEKRQSGQGTVINYKPKQRFQTSRQISKFGNYVEELRPPIEPRKLIKTAEESDILPQLIDAEATNLCLFGWGIRYKPEFDENKATDAEKKQALEEWNRLEEVFKCFNLSMSFERIHYKVLSDRGYIGYGMVEILRNEDREVCGGEYARACDFRICNNHPKEKETSVDIFAYRNNKEKFIPQKKKFKKFVQIVNNEKVYFKEFGDPRTLNWRTGKYSEDTAEDDRATEILMFTYHNPHSEYGLPKWVGAAVNIVGSRKSQEVNFEFFINGKMIPFAILVNGGLLTQESIDALKSGKGMDNFFKAMVLEAKPPSTSIDLTGKNAERPVDLKIQPLTDTSLKDGLFMEYQEKQREVIRSTSRIPKIYIGESSDYNKATAEVAKIIAEEQVFAPERKYIADCYNMILTNEMRLKFCELYLKSPQLADMAELAQALAPFIQAGTVTPNMLIEALGKLLDKDIEALPAEYGNIPIEILKLNVAQAQFQGEQTQQNMEKSATLLVLDNLVQKLGDYLESEEV